MKKYIRTLYHNVFLKKLNWKHQTICLANRTVAARKSYITFEARILLLKKKEK